MIEELDFSEEACIERYVLSSYFDEDRERRIHLDVVPCDDLIVNSLNSYGCINADWNIYETAIASHGHDDDYIVNEYEHFRMAA